MDIKAVLIEKINRAEWWHVPPADPCAYEKRGKFLSSTFLRAEFYGRPNDEPERVNVKNPIFGFSELQILVKLFGSAKAKKYLSTVSDEDYVKGWYERRIGLDAKMYRRAKQLGHDAIILMSPQGKVDLQKGRKPRSVELNVF